MLTPIQAVDRASALLSAARRAGADAAEAIYHGDASLAVNVRLGALEDVERSEGEELGLRLFVGARSASVASADLSSAGMAALVERAMAMAMARAATEDRYAGLAPADRLMTGDAPALDIDDGADPAPDALREAALAAEDAARAVPGVTNSEGASASAGRSVWALATSTGFADGYATSGHGRSASVLAGTGAGMERDHASHFVRHLADLEDAAAIGRRAGERAVARLDPAVAPSGRMPILYDRRVSASLIGHLVGAMAGSAVARRTSFLLDLLGQRVLPAGQSLIDDPHRPRGLRSRAFDAEGVATVSRMLVDDGVLTGWLLDSAAARQLGLSPTGHAARGGAGAPGVSAANVHLAGPTVPLADMIAGLDRAILVTELIGQGLNPVTGDYSRGASGFLIERGKVTRPVSGFTVAGNVRDMLATIVAADDLEHRHGVNAPSLLVDGMMVAGG